MFKEEMATGIGYRLLQLAGGQLPHKKFMKLMYLVERQWIKQTGFTMSGDRLANMNEGPVLSCTYDCMKAGLPRVGVWGTYLSQINNRTVRIVDPQSEPKALTPKQVRVVDTVWQEFGHFSEGDLIAYTHDLPEWHFPNGKSTAISWSEVLRGLGFDEENISDLVARKESFESLQSAIN